MRVSGGASRRNASEGLATGEAGVDLVPPANFQRLATLPAQMHDAIAAHARKIDQAALKVAHDDPEALKALDPQRQLPGDGASRRLRRITARLGLDPAVGADLALGRCGRGL